MPANGQRSEGDLVAARDLVVQHEHRRALKALQRARQSALAEGRVDHLEEVLELAVRLRDETTGKLQYSSGSLAHSTVQNIRFVTRKQALERGEQWVDPTESLPTPAVVAPTSPGPPSPGPREAAPPEDVVARLDRLEQEVAHLRAEVAELPGLVALAPRAGTPTAPTTAAAPATPVAPAAPAETPRVVRTPRAPTPPAQAPSVTTPSASGTVSTPRAAASAAAPTPARPAEWRPAPPPPPPRPPRRTFGELARDWDLMGARGFAIAGGSVMALGIGLFFVLAANRGWIDAETRVLLGAIASALVLGAGLVLRARYGQYWSALAAVGAGIAGAYATLAAAAARYDVIPDALALPLAGVIATIGTVIAVRWQSQVIAAIGLLGAALSPALQALDTELTWISAAFAAIVLVAAGAVSVPLGWRELLLATSVIVGAQVQWLVTEAGSPPGAGTIVVASAVALTLLGVAVGLQLARAAHELDELALVYATAAFAVALMWSIQLFGERTDRGIALLAASAAWALVCGGLLRAKQPDLGLVVGVSALALAAVGTASLLSDAALTVAWAAEALVLVVVARRIGDARLQATGFVYVVLAAVSALASDARPAYFFDDGSDQLAAVLPLAAVALATLAAGLVTPVSYRERTETGLLAFVRDLRAGLDAHRTGVRETFVFAGIAFATLAGSFLAVSVSFEWGHVVASALAAGVGAAVLVGAGRRRSTNLAVASYLWLAVVLVEAFAFDVDSFYDDLTDLSKGGWSVLAAAAALLLGGYVHRRLDSDRRGADVLLGVSAGVVAVSAEAGISLLTDSDRVSGVGLLAVAAVYGALAAGVFVRRGFRNASTILWSFGLVFLVGAESLLVTDSVWRAVAIAATAFGVGVFARPLAETRLWLAGDSLVIVTTAVVVLGLVQPWTDEGAIDLRTALASGACALAAAGLASLFWLEERWRDVLTVVWVTGIVALLVTERAVLDDWRATLFAVAITGGVLALLARPLGEHRVWLGGAVVVSTASAATVAFLTPPEHFFSASASPGDALWVLVGCVAAAGAVAVTAPRPHDRVVLEAVAGGLALYAVSLGILEIAERVSTASVATDFERGHTAVSGLWALIGLALLVVGLLKGSAAIRYGGLALFGVSLAKIFLYDLSELSSVARAFSFILVGGLLLAGGFFLQRLSDRIGPRAPRHP